MQDEQQLQAAVGGTEAHTLLGPISLTHTTAELEDITPAYTTGIDNNNIQGVSCNTTEEESSTNQERQISHPVRPKLDLELPYKQYKLVLGDGTPVERTDKHPFCMSRVYYDASEKPQEVWTELLDRSCRWRQTGSEILIQALTVPKDTRPRDLLVTFQPYSMKVASKVTGEVYLEGQLERGVVPEECWWTHCGGTGEDGLVVSLKKMNLELLQRFVLFVSKIQLLMKCFQLLLRLFNSLCKNAERNLSDFVAGIGCIVRCGGPDCSATTPL